MQQQAPAEHTAANTTGVTISKQATSRAHATENTTTPRRKCALLAHGLLTRYSVRTSVRPTTTTTTTTAAAAAAAATTTTTTTGTQQDTQAWEE